MNPRIKHIAFGSSHEVVPTASSEGIVSKVQPAETLRDEAALLLSIADICNKEMKDSGISMLWSDAADEDTALFPKFPVLTKHPLLPSEGEEEDTTVLKPRSELPREPLRYPLRPRAVSMDSGRLATIYIDDSDDSEEADERSVSSPVSFPSLALPIVTPTTTVSLVSHRRLPMRKTSSRHLKQAKREHHRETNTAPKAERPCVSGKDKKGAKLQGIPPKGVATKKIMRKKFSWKNYPEVCALYA